MAINSEQQPSKDNKTVVKKQTIDDSCLLLMHPYTSSPLHTRQMATPALTKNPPRHLPDFIHRLSNFDSLSKMGLVRGATRACVLPSCTRSTSEPTLLQISALAKPRYQQIEAAGILGPRPHPCFAFVPTRSSHHGRRYNYLQRPPSTMTNPPAPLSMSSEPGRKEKKLTMRRVDKLPTRVIRNEC